MMRGDSDTEDSFSGDEETEESSTIRARLDASSRLIQTSSAAEAPAAGSASATASKPAEDKDDSSVHIQGERSKQDSGNQEEEASASLSKKDGEGSSSSGSGKEEDVGDSEMAPIYLKRLLPIFTEIYHSSLAPPLRKESLRLMRKMMHYIAAPNLQELCNEAAVTASTSADSSSSSHPPFSAQISEVIAAVLENEDDHEGHLSALNIMQELLAKDRESFDEQFARLGLPTKIAALAGPAMEDETEVEEEDREDSERGSGESSEGATGRSDERTAAAADECDEEPEKRRATKKKRSKKSKGAEKKQQQQAEEGGAKKEQPSMAQEDASEIVLFVAYQWREWCVVRSRDCLYLWNSCCAIELSSVSNGWFRFLVDNRLATMYSSGSTEGGPDSHGKGY